MGKRASASEFEYWENILKKEGLGVLNEEKGISQAKKTVKKKTISLLDISDIEDQKKVKFQIEADTQSISLYSLDGNLIGYIKPGFYTYGAVSKPNHLERKIFDDYVGKGYGQLLYDVYKGLNYFVPKEEFTHKASVIAFLQKNGYQLVSRFDENGEEIELSETEIYQLEADIQESKNLGDEDLDYTYKLVL